MFQLVPVTDFPNAPLSKYMSHFPIFLEYDVDDCEEYYEKRCNITYESCLFLSDYDLFGNIRQQDEDWVMRLELLQAARMAFFNWIRRKS